MKLIIAYSGGLDSHCLLHMCAKRHADIIGEFGAAELLSVHVNHSLSPNADAWRQHCQGICAELAIPFRAVKVNIEQNSGVSLEATARAARYQALAQFVEPGDVLLTAQHIDDQAETFLLQALRGAGPKGLASMPFEKPFHAGKQRRPLLHWSQDDLLTYAQQHQLQWIEDESNVDQRFDRNYVRHQIMPIIKQRWPSVAETFAQSSRYCAEAQQLLDEFAEFDLSTILVDDAIEIEPLLKLSQARQYNAVRHWLREQVGAVPSEKVLARIFTEMIPAAADAEPTVTWPAASVRRFQQRLYLTLPSSLAGQIETAWHWAQPLALSRYQLIAEPTQSIGLAVERIPAQLMVKFRQGGEKIKPYGSQHTRELKKLFQAWQVPPWQRNSIPLIYAGDDLLAVANYCYSADYAVANGERLAITWQAVTSD